MESSAVRLCFALIFAVVCTRICTQTDIMDILEGMDEGNVEYEAESQKEMILDTFQLKPNFISVNCRMSCGLLDYTLTCGCIESQCTMWKNPCVAQCSGAVIDLDKGEEACKASNVEVNLTRLNRKLHEIEVYNSPTQIEADEIEPEE